MAGTEQSHSSQNSLVPSGKWGIPRIQGMSRQSRRNQPGTAPRWKPGIWFSSISPSFHHSPFPSAEVPDVEKLRRVLMWNNRESMAGKEGGVSLERCLWWERCQPARSGAGPGWRMRMLPWCATPRGVRAGLAQTLVLGGVWAGAIILTISPKLL